MNFETDFKKKLIEKFNEKKYGRSKDKTLSSNSIKLYLRNLEKLNDDMPLKNLNFLKDITVIEDKLSDYKENTKRGYLISICSALNTESDKKFNKTYDSYYKLLCQKNDTIKSNEGENKMSETQKNNWIKWDDVKTNLPITLATESSKKK